MSNECTEAKVSYLYFTATEEYILCFEVAMNNTLLMLQWNDRVEGTINIL